MTLQNTAKVLKMLCKAYPKSGIMPDEETVQLWNMMLDDMDDALIIAAIKSMIARSPYPPTIAEVRKNAVELARGTEGQLTGAEAWGIVQNAIGRYGYMQQSEALASMPPDVAQLVKRFGWKELCMEPINTTGVMRGQFIKAYDATAARNKEQLQIPASLREGFAALSSGMKMRQLEGGKDDE